VSAFDWKIDRLPAIDGEPPAAPAFGLLGYDTLNIGDDIQALAALQFMPRVDVVTIRDRLAEPPPAAWAAGSVRTILNGWFMGRPSWPPAPHIRPVFLSFHISRERYADYGDRAGVDFMLDDASVEYFRRWGPIGCRDRSTESLLHAAGVDAYFTGCLTLTLPRPPVPRTETIDFSDVRRDTSALIAVAPESVRRRIHRVQHGYDVPGAAAAERMAHAAGLLELYAGAALVVTSRLHCALPCLAFGTPVWFVPPREDLLRLHGLEELLHVLALDGERIVPPESDWFHPRPNRGAHEPLARALEAECRSAMEP
jgi:hypothetical protein